MRLLQASFATAALLGCGPAFAGETRCLWNALAPATQDRLLAAYSGSGAAGVADAKLEPAEARRQMTHCAELGGVVDPKRAVKAMGLALQGFVVQHGALRQLAALNGPNDQQLDLAWRELGPEKRALLRQQAEKKGEAPNRDAEWPAAAGPVIQELLDAVARLTLHDRTDPAVQRELDAYVAGRSLQEAFEPRF